MPLAFFDLDNTLIDRAASFLRWADRLTSEHGLERADVAWLVEADGDGFVPRGQFLAKIRERYGIDLALTSYQAGILDMVELDPAVSIALDGLRASGWRVAIVTNGQTRQQSAKIRRTGLNQHVDAVAISEEVGEKKPDRLIFEVAAQRCGARLSDGGWMVGDSPEADVGGGRGAGLRTVWLPRGREWDETLPPPSRVADGVLSAITVVDPEAIASGAKVVDSLAETDTLPPLEA